MWHTDVCIKPVLADHRPVLTHSIFCVWKNWLEIQVPLDITMATAGTRHGLLGNRAGKEQHGDEEGHWGNREVRANVIGSHWPLVFHSPSPLSHIHGPLPLWWETLLAWRGEENSQVRLHLNIQTIFIHPNLLINKSVSVIKYFDRLVNG